VLDKFVYDPNATGKQVLINFAVGAFRFISFSKDPTGYELKTPTATPRLHDRQPAGSGRRPRRRPGQRQRQLAQRRQRRRQPRWQRARHRQRRQQQRRW
jgi:hypothetical protein